MGAMWVDGLWPDRYPTTATWFEAIARSGDVRLRPAGFPARNWTADMLSMVALGEFAAGPSRSYWLRAGAWSGMDRGLLRVSSGRQAQNKAPPAESFEPLASSDTAGSSMPLTEPE